MARWLDTIEFGLVPCSKVSLKRFPSRLIRYSEEAPVSEYLVRIFSGVLRHSQKTVPALADVDKFIALVEEVDTRTSAVQRNLGKQ